MRPSGLVLRLLIPAPLAAADKPGTTRVATWKDDKQAAFMLMFDDSCQTHVKNAIPELVKRGMVGTFYLNPGSGHYAALKNNWEKTHVKNAIPELVKRGMVGTFYLNPGSGH